MNLGLIISPNCGSHMNDIKCNTGNILNNFEGMTMTADTV